MKLAGTHAFPFPRATVWAALMDPAVLARTLPGCERLERTAEQRFTGTMSVAVGPVKGTFQGTLEMSELAPPERYHMRIDGQGPSGFVKGEGAIALEETPEGTLLRYDLDAQVGGRLAGVGQRLLDSSAKVVARQGLEGLGEQLRLRAAAPPAVETATSEPVSAAGPAGAAFAGRFAREVAAEMVPPGARRWLLVGAVVVAAALVLLLARSCG
ncbi:MAG TPA: carbon monoxide dehydrogenase subunit G [Thermoanaerobaculia bacterium]|jgi:hypothetical protein|nr:carbon monoxide dehydrogenase subunit G [Thermoanaerobaculia bacterium]